VFCDSIDGAQALAIMYTIVETAKASNANVYYYLKYILEKMPCYMDGTDTGFLDTMLPWSLEYKEYERICISGIRSEVTPGIYASIPGTPKKSSRSFTNKDGAA
jgi:hypothetical protein